VVDDLKEVNVIRMVTLYLPELYIETLDRLVTEGLYPHRAEAIRVAIRDLLNTEAWRVGEQ